MFKLAQLSDIHADYHTAKITNSQGINLREADGYVAFSKCVTEIIKAEVDAVVICGDLFHTPTPSIRAIIFVQNQLRLLAKNGIPVYALTGNHDTNDIRADVSASRVVHDPARKIYSHAEPYVMHTIAPGINLHMVSHHMYSEQADTMKLIKPVDGEINIFSTHGSIIDPILQERLHTNQSPREIVIPDYMFKDFEWNYALLGHIHERGWVGSKDGKTDTLKKKIYYNGSLIRRGFSDAECALGRGWTLWEIESDGTMIAKPQTVPQRPQMDFPIIDCVDLSAQEISDRIVENLRATQVDDKPEFVNATAPILRQRLKNLAQTKYAALDWQNIDKNQKHALAWDIKVLSVEDTKTDTNDDNTDSKEFEGSDIVSIYDKWVDRSEAMKNADEKIKERIRKETRKFVEAGQEAVLIDEEE